VENLDKTVTMEVVNTFKRATNNRKFGLKGHLLTNDLDNIEGLEGDIDLQHMHTATLVEQEAVMTTKYLKDVFRDNKYIAYVAAITKDKNEQVSEHLVSIPGVLYE
jgi:ribosomal protein S17